MLGTNENVPHLYGKTCFGDNIEDEWFTVFLLFQLTEAFQGVVAKVWDNDGEFLLIEAANSLPKWLNPDTAENRIFLYKGKMHIIPRPNTPAELTSLPTGVPSLADAVTCIRQSGRVTQANQRIQRDLQKRISGFPGCIEDMQQQAHCYIPASLAAILDHTPSLIAPIVQAFYERDPIDLKACVTMKHFRPGTRVMRQVHFTRCLYAQLLQQKFKPDKRSGWDLPATSNKKFKSHDLGTKLAHGAEILCSKCADPTMDDTNASLYSRRWTHFMSALKDKGYFRGQIEGSELYQKLEKDARQYFNDVVNFDDASNTDAGTKILQTLQRVSYDIEEMRRQEQHLPKEDDDDWLDISPEQLDDMMAKSSGRTATSQQSSFDMSNMTESMKNFVETESGLDGVEMQGPEDDIQFDPGSFIQTMQKMFEFEDQDSDSSSGMSEYESDEDLEYNPATNPTKPTVAVKPTIRKQQEKLPTVKTHAAKLASKPAVKTAPLAFVDDEDMSPMDKPSPVRASMNRPTRPPRPPRPTFAPPARPNVPPPPVPARPEASASNGITGNNTANHIGNNASNGQPAKAEGVGDFLGLGDYMRMMDKELVNTEVGKSFERVTTKQKPTMKPVPRRPVPPSVPKGAAPRASMDMDDDLDEEIEDDEFEPVDVDLNMVKNLLESYSSQGGLSGPTSNLLSSLGVSLPPPDQAHK